MARETFPGERRVAVIPSVIPSLTALGLDVAVERGAGEAAGFPDPLYAEKGARLLSRVEVFAAADLLLAVRSLASSHIAPPPDLSLLREGQAVVGFLDPIGAPEGVKALAERGVVAFALDLIPRISRAQAMDALSSVATVIGYKAVLLAADTLPRLFPLMMTAGGTLTPARMLVIGAGVAGLQAIATGRRLGAVVEAYDIRPATREQIQSLGAKYVELPLDAQDAQDEAGYARAMDESFYRRQRETMGRVVSASDVVISTAAIPGRKAPVLITAEMVDAMRPGSVIVDVAAEQGGNCELTRPGEAVVRGGVTVLGPVNVASAVPNHASQLHARNVANFLALVVKQGRLTIDLADQIVRETLVARGGEVVHPRLRETLGLPPAPAPPTTAAG
ncbi:MAG TPA: Re/Si-specific NAD(P)(+) transhydrogenase subunit alpha [Vicinamibacteria bacterium]|nr:Re/Si-specific NAD(P)(+) transhydrogenase subunit alpha [Vicinamibacteria bacterium]